ncbi:MAG: DnaJ domain-containing protein [Pseudomonadota bacterium]
MLYLLVGSVALAVLLFVGTRFVQSSPADIAHLVRTFVGVFGALAGTGLLLAGRIGLAAVIILAAVITFRSMRVNSADIDGSRASDSTSTVQTAYLEMHLDTATQIIDGMVRAGSFRGRKLSELAMNSVLQLLREVSRDDPQSVPLIETYLDYKWAEWRDDPAWSEQDSGLHSATANAMDDKLALQILGLEEKASVEEIKGAHRRLLAQLHPDHGGSNYLAAQINEAKAHLLRSRRGV